MQQNHFGQITILFSKLFKIKIGFEAAKQLIKESIFLFSNDTT